MSRIQARARVREWLILGALALAGIAAAALWFDDVFLPARLDLSIDRAGAVERAEAMLEHHDIDASAYADRLAVFSTRRVLDAYAQRADVADSLRAAIARHRPAHEWLVVWSGPDAGRVEVRMDGSGRVVTLQQVLPDDAAPGHLESGQAQELARTAFDALPLDAPDAYRLVDATTQRGPERTDHAFSWERIVDTETDVRTRVRVDVAGTDVSGWWREVKLPEAWRARVEATGERSDAFDIWQVVLGMLVGMIALIVFVSRFRAREIELRNGLAAGALLFASYVVFVFGSFDASLVASLRAGQDNLAVMIVVHVFNLAIPSLLLVLVWTAGESLTQERWPAKLTAIQAASRGVLFTPPLGWALVRGALLACALVGAISVAATLALGGDAWRATASMSVRALSSPAPVVLALATSLVGALLGAGYAILFTLPLLRRLGLALWAAAGLTAAFYGFFFTEDVVINPYWRMGLVGIVASTISVLVYLRYDLATYFACLFFAAFGAWSLGLLLQPSTALALQGGVGVAIVLALVAFGVAAGLRGRRLDPEAMQPSYARFISDRERMKMELDIARRAQLRMLPRVLPALPGLELAAVSEPAREVGGDYYDVLPMGPDRLALVVADVSGKGMPAALYMTLLKGAVQTLAETAAGPEALARVVNRTFVQAAEPGVFVTMLVADFDLSARRLTLVRAGHQPALLLRAATGEVERLRPRGVGIGLVHDDRFGALLAESRVALEAGDVLVLFTDGLDEARAPDGRDYGYDRIADVVREHAHGGADAVADALRRSVHQFMARAEAHDDLTFVVARIGPAPSPAAMP